MGRAVDKPRKIRLIEFHTMSLLNFAVRKVIYIDG